MGNKCILVTGATGFLGAHIVNNLIGNTDAVIYCLVRVESIDDAHDRLQETLLYYFNWRTFDNARIKIIKGDFTQANLGMTVEEWEYSRVNIDIVIHAGALVKHFGLENDFREVNIMGTQNIIDFAKNNNIFMIYISTMAVAGRFHELENKIFSEQDFMSKSNLPRNIYVRSKAESEECIVHAVKEGLMCNIIRVGAITGRYRDGRFQKNKVDNALYSRVQVIVRSGIIPSQFIDLAVEFSPVDYCSEAIVQILKQGNTSFEIYHLYNNNVMTYGVLINYLISLGYVIRSNQQLSYREFKQLAKQEKTKEAIYTGFCLFMRNLDKFNNCYPITISCENTLSRLNEMGFNWPVIDKEYIKKMVDEIFQHEEDAVSIKNI